MNRVTLQFVAACSIFLVTGCAEDPASSALHSITGPGSPLASEGVGPTGGALVFNSGEGQPDPFCFFGAFTTNDATTTREPSGNAMLSCRFEGLPPIVEEETLTGWVCTIRAGGVSQTRQSQWVRTTTGTAHLTCHFSGKPFFDAAVSAGDISASAQQASFTTPLADVAGQRVSGELVNVGLACAPIAADLTGKVALIERGVCAFSDKLANARNAGASAAVVYNSAPFGDQIITMGGVGPVPIPGVFVGRSTGLALLAAGPVEVTITYCTRSSSCRGEL